MVIISKNDLNKILIFFLLVFFTGLLFAQELEVRVIPSGELQKLDLATEISITFNKSMVPIGIIAQEYIPDFISITPPLKGKFYWSGDRTLVFHPEGRLPYSTSFEIMIKKGLKSLTGERLEKDLQFAFETPSPSVIESYPPQELVIEREGTIVLVFNQAVPLEEIESKIQISIFRSYYNIPHGYSTDSKEALDRIARVRTSLLSREGRGFSLPLKAQYDKGITNRIILTPSQAFPLNSVAKVIIPKGLKGVEGNLVSKKEQTFDFHTPKTFLYGGISCKKCNPYHSISIVFSNSVISKEVIKSLKLVDLTEGKDAERKPIEGNDYYYRPHERIYIEDCFNLKAGHSYRLEIMPDLEDIHGLRLGYSVEEEFTLLNYPFSIDLINRTGIIESKGPKYLSLRVMNVDSVIREVREVGDNEIGQYLSFVEDNKSHFLNESSPEIKLKTALNSSAIINMDIGKIINKEEGIVYAEVKAKNVKPGTDYEKETEFVNGLLQVTDIGISLKYSPGNLLVYTTSLSSGKPLPDAEIKIMDKVGKLLWQGRADDNGLCLAPGLDDFGIKDEWETDFIVIAKSETDRAFVIDEWNYGIEGWDFNISLDWFAKKRNLEGFLFTDRGAYRPGEDVYLKSIFRIGEADKLTIPPTGEIEFKVYDSREKEVEAKKALLNPLGSASFSFKIPEGSPTGNWRIEAKVPKELKIESKDCFFRHSILVAEYRKPEFRVDVSVPKKDYIPEETINGIIKGTYLYGAAMKDCKVKWSLRRSPTDFRPPLKGELQGKDYVFEDRTKERKYNGSEVVGSGEGTLGKDGTFLVEHKPAFFEEPMRYHLEGEVVDVTEQSISNRTSFLVHPSNFYIGLEWTSYFIDKGKGFKTSIIALDHNGDALEEMPIKIELIKREWHSVQEKEEGFYYRYRSEKVDTLLKSSEITSSEKPVPVEFPVEESGYYLIKASAKDERGNAISSGYGFYCIGDGFTAWERYDHNRMDLVPERESYNPGETARILVKSPWEESDGIVTLERTTIINYYPVHLKGSNQVVEIPIRKEHIPNLYVSILLVKGRTSEKLEEGADVGKPTFRIGYTKLNIVPDEVYLKVDMKTEKEEYRPRERVNLTLQVKGYGGEGRKAELTLYAVDYGVLSLTGYKIPDPVSYFYGEKGLGVQNAESRVVLISREYLKGKLAEEAGGGGMEEGLFQLRTDFRVTPFWKAEVLTDEGGNASESFELPDALTSFVIIGVAQTEDSHFGSISKEIRVSKPLMSFAFLPRFLITGDKFDGALRIQNNTKDEGELNIKAQSLTKNIEIEEGEKTTKLAPESSFLVRFPMRASLAGRGKIRFYALFKTPSREERDAIEIDVPIKTPKIRIDSATYGSTDSKETLKVFVPENIQTDLGGLRITLSSSALADLEKSAEFLLEYPFGCTEQLTSMLIPFIALKNLTGAFKFKNIDEKMIDKVFDETISKIYKNQKEDGGFGFWVDSQDSFPYLSSYVLFIFKMAELRGFRVDKDAKEKLISYLKDTLKGKIKIQYGSELITKALILYSLSLYESHDESYQTLLYERRESLPLFAKAYLLLSLHRAKKGSLMEKNLLKEIINNLRVEAREAHFEEGSFDEEKILMHSNLRSNAIILMSLLEVDPQSEFIVKLVAYILGKRRNGMWRNTQENGYALLSLSEYLRLLESGEIGFRFKGRMDKKSLPSLDFKEIKKEIINISMEEIQKILKGRELTVLLEKSGKGKLFYGLNLSFYPKGLDFPAIDQGFSVQRIYEDLNTGERKDSFSQGELIRVRIKVNVTAERNYVAIVDPIPAGTEIENAYLKTTNLESQKKLGYLSWYFNHVEGYDDRMQAFADYLPQGDHEFSYIVRATTKGTFFVPSTKIEEMYDPEQFGTTEGKVIKIE